MFSWEQIPLWRLTRTGNLYVVKVNPTSVRTTASDSYKDTNVCIDLHTTENNRLIGYTLKERRRPRSLVGDFYLGLFYSNLKSIEEATHKAINIIYHDYNVRLLAFGDDGKHRDYMWVMRTKPPEDSYD